MFARNKPPTPPSAAASRKEEPMNFKKNLKELLGNRSYLLLCVSFTMLYGIYTSLGAVVAAVTGPYGYDGVDNAIFGAIFIFFGVVGSFTLGVILDKTAKYKLMINGTSTSAVALVLLGLVTLPSGVALFSLNLALIGFAVIPIIPIAYGFAVELTFPIPEAMSNGMMILPSQIFGALMGAIAGYICGIYKDTDNPKRGPQLAIILFASSALIGSLCSFFIIEELRRLRPKDTPEA
jgi:MFS family permease